jgi:hypothetical protein
MRVSEKRAVPGFEQGVFDDLLADPRVCSNCFTFTREPRVIPAEEPRDLGDETEPPVLRRSVRESLDTDYYPSYRGGTDRDRAGQRRHCRGCGSFGNFTSWLTGDPISTEVAVDLAANLRETLRKLGYAFHEPTLLNVVEEGKYDSNMTGKTHLVFRVAVATARLVAYLDDPLLTRAMVTQNVEFDLE